MQVFLGDEITLVNDGDGEQTPTFVTGQVAGVVLDKHRKVERVYIHNLSSAFWMSEGWKFVEEYEPEESEDE